MTYQLAIHGNYNPEYYHFSDPNELVRFLLGEVVDGVAAGGVWGEVGDGVLPVEVIGDVFAFGGEPDVVGDASVGEELGDVFGVGVSWLVVVCDDVDEGCSGEEVCEFVGEFACSS